MAKKITRVIALALVFSLVCIALASCGKTLSGTYENNGVFGLGAAELTFKGSKVTIEMGGIKAEGTYSVDEDKITIEFVDSDENDVSLGDLFQVFNGTHSFEKGDDYIKINGTKYTKAE